LQTRALQDLHIAHDLHSLSKNAAVSGATAPKTAYKYLCAHCEIIVAHIVKEAKRSPSQADLAGSPWRDKTTIDFPIRKKPLEDYNGLGNS
jgi:hypothetical protein